MYRYCPKCGQMFMPIGIILICDHCWVAIIPMGEKTFVPPAEMTTGVSERLPFVPP